MGDRKEKKTRSERALWISSIVEKWWRGKVNKVVNNYEVFYKERGPGETNERKTEELQKLQRQERLDSLILQERKAQRERSP
jgi:hypothetical protein